MGKTKLIEYIVINESLYQGEGHIINIAKRHTNRRWRQYTPQKECNIELQLIKLSFIKSIELKGFGTYIVEISFKDADNKLVTKLKYNFDFFDESIKEDIVCEKEVKYVDLKLVNSQQNPKRMGINHFFMRGTTVKVDGQDSDDDKKKKRKPMPSQVWVRQKVQGEDPWKVDDSEESDADEGSTKAIANTNLDADGKKGSKRKLQSKIKQETKSSDTKLKRQQPVLPFLKNQIYYTVHQIRQNQLREKAKAQKKAKLNEEVMQGEDVIKLELSKSNADENKNVSGAKKFEEKFNLKPQTQKTDNLKNISERIVLQHSKEETQERQDALVNQSQEERKMRVKMELIQKLKDKMQPKL